MYRFFKQKITNKCLSDTMYAILKTEAKLTSSFCIGMYDINRRQASGLTADVVINIEPEKIEEFESLTGIKLKTHQEVHGGITFNSCSEDLKNMKRRKEK